MSETTDSIEIKKYLLIINFCTLTFGVVGNTTVCIVIVCSRSLHTLTDIYLFNLSIIDLFNLITRNLSDYYDYCALTYIEPMEGETDYKPQGYVFHNRAAHYANFWISMTSFYASVFTVTAFTIERYLAICRPFVAQSMPKTSRVKAIIVGVWSISALITSMILTVYYILEETTFNPVTRVVIHVTNVFAYSCYIMPCLAITLMYILIGRKLKRVPVERPRTLQTNRGNAKTLTMFGVIIVIAFLSWIPTFTVWLLNTCCPNGDDWNEFSIKLDYVASVTYTLASVLNPVIYTIMSRNFREALKDLSSKTRKKLDCRTDVVTTVQTAESALEMT